MHTAQSICKSVRSRTCSHVIWVQSASCTAATSYREVFFACEQAFLLVSTCNRVLETCRVCRVSCDRNINILVPHDCNTFANIISTVALYDKTLRIISIRNFFNNCQSLVCSFAVKVVKLSLNISKTIDAADNLGSVFSKTVQDNAELVPANFVCVCSDFNRTFSSSKRFVACQKSKTLSFFRKKAGTKISVSKTNLAVISYRTWQTECLKSFSDICSSCRTSLVASFFSLFNCNRRAQYVSPFCIFKTNLLCRLTDFIRVKTACLAKFTSLVQSFFAFCETIFFKSLVYLWDTAFKIFK